MNQTYNKKFHCTYLLHHYPFDTQVGYPGWTKEHNLLAWFRFARWTCSCRSSPSAMWCWSRTTSRSSPTPSSRSTSSRHGVCSTISMVQHQKHLALSKCEIIVSLGEPEKGLKMEIVFKRRLTNELMTTYLPSALLLLISYATVFFKPFYFEAAVTVNLSLLLVITTLFVRRVQTYLQNPKLKRQISAWWKNFLPRLMFVW